MKIPLPELKESMPLKAHSYPFRVGLQTQELMHASFFHAMLADLSAGEYLRQPGNIDKLEARLSQEGLQRDALQSGWQCLGKYKIIFERAVFQSSVIAMSSHWDWYMRKLGQFVRFARTHVPSPVLNSKQENS